MTHDAYASSAICTEISKYINQQIGHEHNGNCKCLDLAHRSEIWCSWCKLRMNCRPMCDRVDQLNSRVYIPILNIPYWRWDDRSPCSVFWCAGNRSTSHPCIWAAITFYYNSTVTCSISSIWFDIASFLFSMRTLRSQGNEMPAHKEEMAVVVVIQIYLGLWLATWLPGEPWPTPWLLDVYRGWNTKPVFIGDYENLL